jgi:hypothetical protein
MRTVPERVLSARPNNKGYATVALSRAGKQKDKTVHALVAEAFLGPRPQGRYVLHGPGGQADNRPCNLRYGTQKENCADKWRDGTVVLGSKHPESKLSEADVLYIKRELKRKTKNTVRILAAKFNVSAGLIRHIEKGRAWTWLADFNTES